MPLDCLIWLVPLLPFAGFLLNGFVGRKLPRILVGLIGCGTVFASFVIAVITFYHVHGLGEGGELVSKSIAWIRVPGLGEESAILKFLAEHKLVADHLGCLMMLVVTGVGFLIHLYSVGYMAEDRRYARYFAYLNLFTGFMLVLVLASNLFLMFVGWEGVGLCSYLLIGFWFEDVNNAKAGKKAFIVNRIGDFCFTVGVLTLFVYLGETFGTWTVDFGVLRETLASHKTEVSAGLLTFVGIMLFGGATGKSAQIPLYTWLPDAMAGPTPVSALIHAATMVTAGVYMVARMGFLYELAPVAMLVVAVVGGVTAIFAGTIAVCQNDIKKVLAYSTVSQLGYMFMGVGSGFFFAGIFHLMTHAFFKACLFLGSGSVIHGMGGEQDIRKMGGLAKRMPITCVTFIIASLALAGLPFVTSGFFSKEAVLGALWSSAGHGPLEGIQFAWLGKVFALVGFAGAGLTAFYMTRLVIKTFFGEERWRGAMAHGGGHGHGHGHGEPHESPWTMTTPLVILALFSIIGGFGFLFDVYEWLPGSHGEPHGPWWFKWILSFAMSLGGIGLGFWLYWMRRDIPERVARNHPLVYNVVLNKYYVDEIYDKTVILGAVETARACGAVDNFVVDGAVNLAGQVTAVSSQGAGGFDNDVVDGGVNGAGWLVRKTGSCLRKLQTGNIKAYLTGAVVGAIVVIAAFCVYLLGVKP